MSRGYTQEYELSCQTSRDKGKQVRSYTYEPIVESDVLGVACCHTLPIILSFT